MIDKSIIDLLIEKGVDVTCKDQVICFHSKLKAIYKREFKNGNKPHQVARDGETRALLRQHHVRHHFGSIPVCNYFKRTSPDFRFFEKWFVRIQLNCA